MKISGVSCETKFRLLVFLGHPTGQPTLPNHLVTNLFFGILHVLVLAAFFGVEVVQQILFTR